ncbi:MAG: cation efflux protein, CzcI family [Giesbergeria sp.]
MRRLIAVFLLGLLPFQFSWSAVAAYCKHESTTAQVQHVGHHEHKHESKIAIDQADKNGQSADQFDIDCWVCHGAGIGALNLSYVKQGSSHDGRVGAQPNEQLAGVTPTPPDRPRWPVLA